MKSAVPGEQGLTYSAIRIVIDLQMNSIVMVAVVRATTKNVKNRKPKA